MSAVFAPQDVATLVESFTPSILDNLPELVRSYSGDALVDSDQARAELQNLLNRESSDRIPRQELPLILGIDIDVAALLLDECAEDTIFNRDGLTLVPKRELNSILDTFDQDANNGFVDLVDLSSRVDINLDGLLRLVTSSTKSKPKVYTINGKTIACSSEYWTKCISQIIEASSAAASDIVDLKDVLVDVPSLEVLRDIAEEANLSADGELQSDDEKLLFIPSTHAAAELERNEQQRTDKIRELVRSLEIQSYCILTPTTIEMKSVTCHTYESTIEAILTEYEQSHPNGAKVCTVLKPANSSEKDSRECLIILAEALESSIKTLKDLIITNAEDLWYDGDMNLKPTELVSLVRQAFIREGQETALNEIIAQSDYKSELEEVAKNEIAKLGPKYHQKLTDVLNEHLTAPMQMYAAGIATIKDANLKQNLHVFVLDHFRVYHANRIGSEIFGRSILPRKLWKTEFEKFSQASQKAKDFDEEQAAVQKLMRKLKVPYPSREVQQDVKKRNLVITLRYQVSKLLPSVVLQNVVWILLAHKSEGIFISSGKDTSRMIKQYEAVGDPSIAAKLRKWRDLAKAEQVTDSDLADMRETARAAMQDLYGQEAFP